MDLARLEHDIRTVPGVLACQVTAGEVSVLVAPDADADAVSAAIAGLLTAVAAAPVVRVVGGRAPVVPLRRRLSGRRAVAALSAGAAALAAAGVAAASNGVFSIGRDQRPSVSSTRLVSPPSTRSAALDATSDVAAGDVRRHERRSTSPPTTLAGLPQSDVQPDRQLATLGVGEPTVLTVPIPLPGEIAAPLPPSHRHGPKVTVAPLDVAAPAVVAAPTVVVPSTGAPATVPTAPTVPTSTTLPPAVPVVVRPVRPVPVPTATTVTTAVVRGDTHDNDRGENDHDSNGHDTKGPQGKGWTRGARR